VGPNGPNGSATVSNWGVRGAFTGGVDVATKEDGIGGTDDVGFSLT